MVKCETYIAMLTKSPLTQELEEKVCSILKKYENDIFISVQPTQLNEITSKTLSITVLRESLEKAEPIYQLINEELEKNNLSAIKTTTWLWYGKDAIKFYQSLS